MSIDHVSVGVTNMKRAKAFYDATLAPLGMIPVFPVEMGGQLVGVGYGTANKPSFWIQLPINGQAASMGNGVHIASLAGAWLAAVAGFGGLRDHDGKLSFSPRLPPRIERLTFRLLFCGRRLKVDVTRTEATYALLDGPPLGIAHHGEGVEVGSDEPATRPIPPIPQRPAPQQPAGRAPALRGSDGSA